MPQKDTNTMVYRNAAGNGEGNERTSEIILKINVGDALKPDWME